MPKAYMKRQQGGFKSYDQKMTPKRKVVRGDYLKQRAGYTSVARSRGAAVTGEMKYFDTENSGLTLAAVTTTWVAGTLCDPTSTINLGDAAVANPGTLFAPKATAALNGRVGRAVKVMKVKVRGQITVPAQTAQSGADASTRIRLLLVQDQQSNAASMTAAQLLNDAGAAVSTINSYQNPNQFGRFRVLKDKSWSISNLNLANDTGTTGGIVQAGMVIPFKFSYFYSQPVEVHFNATNGGTIADVVDHSWHLVCGCQSIAYAPTIAYYTRITYKE